MDNFALCRREDFCKGEAVAEVNHQALRSLVIGVV